MAYKKKPKICIFDYDDTCVDFKGWICDFYNYENNTYSVPDDITEWEFENQKIIDITGNKIDGSGMLKIFKKYEDHGLYASLDPLPKAVDALDIIKDLGYKIVILTARPERFRTQTELNLHRNGFAYDQLILCDKDKDGNPQTKASIIKELSDKYSVELFADDKAETVQDVFEKCKVKHCVVINAAHNKNFDLDEDIARENSVFDCIRKLKKINKRR